MTGLWGMFGNGCIVLTGPDQHFHGSKFGRNWEPNHYNLLVNELDFVSHRCGNPPNLPPTASWVWSIAGDQLTLDGTGSSDPEGTIATYEWEVDGSVLATVSM